MPFFLVPVLVIGGLFLILYTIELSDGPITQWNGTIQQARDSASATPRAQVPIRC